MTDDINSLFQKTTVFCSEQFSGLSEQQKGGCWNKFDSDPEFESLIRKAEDTSDPERVRELLRTYCTKFKDLVRECRNDPECKNQIPEPDRAESDMFENHDSAELWTPGIIDLIPLDTETTEGIKCLGHICEHVSYRESPGASSLLWCGHAKKAVFYILECPLKKWRRVGDVPQDKSERLYSCYSCGSTHFWRGVGNDNLICAVCHPPAIAESEIETICDINLSDMRAARTSEPGEYDNGKSDISSFSCIQCRAFGTQKGVNRCFKRVMFHGKGGKSKQITDTSKTCDEFRLNTDLKN